MKVTALIPDELVEQVRKISGGKNIIESLTIALKAYVKTHTMEKLYDEIEANPMVFMEDFVPFNRNRER